MSSDYDRISQRPLPILAKICCIREHVQVSRCYTECSELCCMLWVQSVKAQVFSFKVEGDTWSTAVKRPTRFSFYLVGFYLMLSGNMGKDV